MTGTGTSFKTDLVVGDAILVGTQEQVITGITSDTVLTTANAFAPVATVSNYSIQKAIAQFNTGAGTSAVVVDPLGQVNIAGNLSANSASVNALTVNGMGFNKIIAQSKVGNSYNWFFNNGNGTGCSTNNCMASYEVYATVFGDANNVSTFVWHITVYGTTGINVTTVSSTIPAGNPAISITRTTQTNPGDAITFSTNGWGVVKNLRYRDL